MLLAFQDEADRSVPISDNTWLDGFRIPFGQWIDQTVTWANNEIEWLLDAIRWPFARLFSLFMNDNVNNDSIMSISWLWIVIGFFLLGSFVRNTKIGFMVAAMVALCGFLGQQYWDQTARTFGMIMVSVLLCTLIGIPFGVLCGRVDAVWNVTRPVLDAMQVVHSFVWMIPFILFWGTGNVVATMMTMLYALPPLVRLTNLGIRQVPEDVVEASRSYGANEFKVLTDVQLPLARQAIMTGLNQTLLLAFAMLGIAAYVGADGLGKLIFRAINNLDIALGFAAGLTFFLCAVVLDRISQPEDDDGLSMFGRINQAFAYRRDAEGTYATSIERAEDFANAAEPEEPVERFEPLLAAERSGLMMVAGGSVVAIIATLLTWGSDAGNVTSWAVRADEDLLGQSFSGLDAQGGSMFGVLVLLASVVAILASVRPLVSISDAVSGRLNQLQGIGLAVLAGSLVISLILNIVDVNFQWLQSLGLIVFGLIGVLVVLDTFVRGTPRMASDGALIAAMAACATAIGFLVLQPSPAVTEFSNGIGVYVAIIATVVAVAGGLMAIRSAPYASRVPLMTSISIPGIFGALVGLGFVWAGASAAWISDERDRDAGRVFTRGLTSDGPLLGWPSIVLAILAVGGALVLAGAFGPRHESRWRTGTITAALGAGLMIMPLAFTLSITRRGDVNYRDDLSAWTGAGIFLVIVGGFIFFSIGRSAIGDYARKKIYADARQVDTAAAPNAAVSNTERDSELVEVGR